MLCGCGCGRSTWNGRPYVRGHHARVNKTGITGRPLTPASIRFWKRVDKSSDCWIWTGFIDKDGYGTFRNDPKSHGGRAHRFSYELVYGKIPEGYEVCHYCDNPSCVNPSHLWLGTRLTNEQDKTRKGRRPIGNREEWNRKKRP